jgi:hypothetical protein
MTQRRRHGGAFKTSFRGMPFFMSEGVRREHLEDPRWFKVF